MSLALTNGLLFVLVIIELLVLYFHQKKEIPWREVIFNLNSGHILMWILRGMEVAAFHLVLTHWSFHLLDNWHIVAVWVFTFFAWDFCFYWLHRLHHRYKFLWAVHVIHHEGEHFGLSLGIRNSWYSSITSFPFFVGLAFIGVPIEAFVAISSFHYFIQFYNHNNIVKNSGWLEHIMITPKHHKVHHGKEEAYINCNFGGTLIIWDKMFGTFRKELEEVPLTIGVQNHVQNNEIVQANNLPFIRLFKPSFQHFKTTTPKLKWSNTSIVTGGFLLFSLLIYYIWFEEIWSDTLKIPFFFIIFLGTIANGGLSEGKRWGLGLWLANFCLIAPAFYYYHSLSEPVLGVLFTLLFLHSCWVVYEGLHKKNVKR